MTSVSYTHLDVYKRQILGFEYGADDYMVKPFNILEVKARIKSVLRRTAGRENAVKTLQVRGLVIDPAARSVQRDGKEINLTAKEFNLLWTMANHIGRVFSREDLHDALWKNERGEENGYDPVSYTHLDVYKRQV